MKQKAVIDYHKLSDANLKVKSQNVVNSLTDNPSFPLTTPTIAQFTEFQTAYASALEKTLTGDRLLIELKNQARKILLEAMKQLATSVNLIANGDKALIISSGFDLTSLAEPVHDIDVSKLTISDGNPGELKFNCAKVEHAVSYVLEWTVEVPTNTTNWHSQTSSGREFILKNLESGTRIYARIRAIGPKGLESVSEVQSRIVQ
jgi:hypothetical protein